MLSQYYEQIDAISLDLCLVVLFALMGMAIHDVLKKNDVPKIGRYITFGVLMFGAFGFLVKGIIKLVLAN
ncbi:DUF2788 domain-containing protein [Neptunicella marina]|uniref:DUF2788 domain-containing protein n=1 Tax=Neptunicella marina TaxID=2125989 RepID=A0A8J6IMV2_9ALTE|nr:DUF2788 domain-containing protein [Neptunicella marina]